MSRDIFYDCWMTSDSFNKCKISHNNHNTKSSFKP